MMNLIIAAICFLYFLLRTAIVRPGHLRFSIFWILYGMLNLVCALCRMVFPCKAAFVAGLLLCAGSFALLAGIALLYIAAVVLNKKAESRDVDYIILLGAYVSGYEPTFEMRKRIEAAAGYLIRHPAAKVICSGGQGPDEPMPEAVVECHNLKLMGISEDRILIEDRSTSSREGIRRSLSLMENPEAATGIVTSDYHVFRCYLLCYLLAKKYFVNEPVFIKADIVGNISFVNWAAREVLVTAVEILRTGRRK